MPRPTSEPTRDETPTELPPNVIRPPAVPPGTPRMPYRGVNLSGAEFGTALPGRDGTDYAFPTTAEVDYYLSKGMNTFRVGFRWERLQRTAYGAFDASYFQKLDAIVKYATSKGAYVVLNPHNFARYYGAVIGSVSVPNAAFADLWTKLANQYAGDGRVVFNLVNEPNGMPTEQWVSAANSAIAAIRTSGAKNLVIVPGNAWTGAHSWFQTFYGTPNAVAMLGVVDPQNNMLFEAHQYLDADSSGGSNECVSATIGSERLVPFVRWLRENGRRGFIGEFAGGRNTRCYAATEDMLRFMMDSADVLDGWLWWGGGPWWGEYSFTLEPTAGGDRPQMALLAPHLTAW